MLRLALGLLLSLGLAAALDNGLALKPPMGWLTWERFRCNTDCQNYPDICISERLIREMADAMVSEGYKDLGYEYIIIDDCWSSHDRAQDGSLVPDPDRFPSGIANLTDYVHSKGLKFGIYGDVGTMTCGGYPGSLEHMEIDAQTFAKWGVDYVKFDGCAAETEDFGINYPKFGAYLNATGRPIVYSCEWPLYQLLGDVEIDYKGIADTCNLWRNYFDIEDSYESYKGILNWHGDNQDKINQYTGRGGWNDPDMLLIGNFALSWDQSKAQMAAWAVMASPLIMSNDLRKMDPAMKAILQNKEVIKVSQDGLTKPGRRVYNNDNIQIWVRSVEPVVNGATSYAVAIISTRTDGAPHRVQISLNDLGITDLSDTYTMTELFDAMPSHQMDKNDNIDVLVPPTGGLLFKLER